MSRLVLAIAHRCAACATVRVLRGAQLTDAPVCPTCGGPVIEGRRATDADWQVRLVLRRLVAVRDSALNANGRFVKLPDSGLYFCEQVRTAACAERWVKTQLYEAATALVNAEQNRRRCAATKSTPEAARRYRAMVVALDTFHFACKRAGVQS